MSLKSNENNSPFQHQPIYTKLNGDNQTSGIDEVDRTFVENCDNEEILNIITELDGTKRQLTAERQRISELEDQLSSLSKCFALNWNRF